MWAAEHRSELTLDLDAVRHNAATMRGVLGATELWAVVKANAYGFGASPVAAAALDAGASALCVATLDEGLALRAEHPRARIVVMGPVTPRGAATALDARLECVAHDAGAVALLAAERVPMHVKLNAGLNRWGQSRLPSRLPGGVVGLMSQFSTDDDAGLIARELDWFLEQTAGASPATRHIANSATTATSPEAHLDAVRCGCALVGISTNTRATLLAELRNPLRWTSYVAQTRTLARNERLGYDDADASIMESTVVAVVPLGYADGFGDAMVGARVRVGDDEGVVVGPVFMDACYIRIPRAVPTGTRVVLVDDDLTFADHAARTGHSPWKLSCAMVSDPRRVRRLYVNSERPVGAALSIG